MVSVKNIKIENSIVSFDYFPNCEKLNGFVRYDMKADKVIEHIPAQIDEWDAYLSHAINVVLDAIEENKIAPVLYEYWY